MPRTTLFSHHSFGLNTRLCIWTSVLLSVVCSSWREWILDDPEDPARESLSFYVAQSVVIEAAKLVLCFASYALWKRRQSLAPLYPSRQSLRDEEESLAGIAGATLVQRAESQAHGSHFSPSLPLQPITHRPTSKGHTVLGALLVSTLCVYSGYNALLARQISDPFTVYLTVSIAPLIILFLSYLLTLPTAGLQWHAVLLQCSGFLIVQVSLKSGWSPQKSHAVLASLALSNALSYILLRHVYTTHSIASLQIFHGILFTAGLVFHAIAFTGLQEQSSLWNLILGFSPVAWLVCFLRVVLDLSAYVVTFYYGSAYAVVLRSTGVAFYINFASVVAGDPTFTLTTGCLLVALGCFIYASHSPNPSTEDGHQHGKARFASPASLRRVASGVLLLAAIFYLLVTASREWRMYGEDAPGEPLTVAGVLSVVAAASIAPACVRKPLQSLEYWPNERTYHVFDNVLLIVFFSHARYDANLDYYREVYSQFFPNIVFVGPGSREDGGFAHSYDVLVDSYQSDEDLTDPRFYKMAGRMAHHMLYTAMSENPCYDGYLWAPFDTMLNVPRLQQFDQRFFWYHSPFAQYVLNPALGDDQENRNASRHAPPANISPDPSLDLTSTWRGVWQDWWRDRWGDPHVGVSVCMDAFNKVPLPLRENLRALTNGTARLIGGSADTLYIPGKHRTVFMDVLALFLETQCFLEIATPTAAHLVVSPDEPILYVDHWWIWRPPFNASFVREQWTGGYEVDTFHTFHWGDRGSDGTWRGNPEHINDVRRLLTESAQRQGVEWPELPTY